MPHSFQCVWKSRGGSGGVSTVVVYMKLSNNINAMHYSICIFTAAILKRKQKHSTTHKEHNATLIII